MARRPLRILLVQVRRAADIMALHERQCIARRAEGRSVDFALENALEQTPEPSWLNGADAVIIGGSGSFGVKDAPSQAWLTGFRRLLDRVLVQDIPGFAICFGHQILGHHLGASVLTEAERAEVGTVSLDLTSGGVRDPLFGGLPRTFTAQTGHSDHVSPVPAGVEVLARNDVLEAQAFRVTGSQLYSTQFHPDLTGAEARERYLAYYGASMPEHARQAVDKFSPVPDDAQTLLRRFIDSVVAPRTCMPAEVLDLDLARGPRPPARRAAGAAGSQRA